MYTKPCSDYSMLYYTESSYLLTHYWIETPIILPLVHPYDTAHHTSPYRVNP